MTDTKVEPVDLIRRAIAAVEQADVPEDLRQLAFAKVLELLANGIAVGKDSKSPEDDAVTRSESSSGQSNPISAISSKIGVSVSTMDRVFDEDDGELVFSGNVAALGSSRSDKVHALALLLLAGRRWAGLDGGGITQDHVVRAEIDRHGLLDVSNYGKHVATLKPFVAISGSGKNATYKIKYDGLEKAKQLARSLAGVD
jgi:hypothetical protein